MKFDDASGTLLAFNLAAADVGIGEKSPRANQIDPSMGRLRSAGELDKSDSEDEGEDKYKVIKSLDDRKLQLTKKKDAIKKSILAWEEAFKATHSGTAPTAADRDDDNDGVCDENETINAQSCIGYQTGDIEPTNKLVCGNNENGDGTGDSCDDCSQTGVTAEGTIITDRNELMKKLMKKD